MDAKTFIMDNAFFFIAIFVVILLFLNKKRADGAHNAKAESFLSEHPDAASLRIYNNHRSSGFKRFEFEELNGDVCTTVKGKYITYYLVPGNYIISCDYFFVTQPIGSKRKTINNITDVKMNIEV